MRNCYDYYSYLRKFYGGYRPIWPKFWVAGGVGPVFGGCVAGGRGMSAELRAGYKQTEVGVIPEDWEVRQMGQIGTLTMGKGLLKEDIRLCGRVPAIPYTALYTDFNEVIDYAEIKWFVDEASAPYVVN